MTSKIHTWSRRRGAAPVATVLLAAMLGGCAGDHPLASGDPLTDVRNPELPVSARTRAVDRAWDGAGMEEGGRPATREALKSLAWSESTPVALRLKALDTLVTDRDEAGIADSRAMVRLMLPREKSLDVINYLSFAAGELGWTDATPSLVRSLSRVQPGEPDEGRPEYKALARLHPGRTIEEVVYGVFVDPKGEPSGFEASPVPRLAADAWDLLARFDRDGSVRMGLLTETVPGETNLLLGDMRAGLADLGAIPLTGEELKWLAALREGAREAPDGWWAGASSANARVEGEKRRGLRLRHAEPIRWAAARAPEWIGASRVELLSELGRRLEGRTHHQRSGDGEQVGAPVREALADWQGKLVWADVLALLVVDEGLREPGVREVVFRHVDLDRADRTTEYGGLLESVDGGNGGRFRAVLYAPRPASRQGDSQFVASAEMVADGVHALAHYHLHVQKPRNGAFAGPSPGDLRYAARSGRTCVVLTSIDGETLNADCYAPDGATIDLGDLTK